MISGWSYGRPLMSNTLLTARSLLARAASPYTVSVGIPMTPPLRSNDAAWVASEPINPAVFMQIENLGAHQ